MCLSYTTEAGDNAPLVLLVEDDASLANLLTEVLSVEIFNGKLPFYHVEQVRSEKAAKSLLRNTLPALCIVEHHPPVIDGLRLYDQMCAIYGTERIPALLISNDLPQMELIRRQFSGLQKPFDLEQFIRLVREILAVSQERGNSLRGKDDIVGKLSSGLLSTEKMWLVGWPVAAQPATSSQKNSAAAQREGFANSIKDGKAHALEPHLCASSLREPAACLSWTAIHAWPFLLTGEQRGLIYQQVKKHRGWSTGKVGNALRARESVKKR